jgi:hypothetical protein
MMEVRVSPPEALRLHKIREILREPGPCVTVYLPPYHPGQPAESPSVLLKTILRDVEKQLMERSVPQLTIREMLSPFGQLATDEGSNLGRIIYAAPRLCRQYWLREPAPAGFSVGSYFEIRRILPELSLPAEYYVLILSKKRVGLVRCVEGRAESVPLPRGTPETLEEVMAFATPDHNLENRWSAGQAGKIRFGTSSMRDTQPAYVAEFYSHVDRGVNEILRPGKTPLILAGVEEDAAIYRRTQTYPELIKESLRGSANDFSPGPELVKEAEAILRAAAMERYSREVARARERFAPDRFLTGADAIVPVAFRGRVSRLYLANGAPQTSIAAKPEESTGASEDLLNVAAVQTLAHDGDVFSLPQETMPERATAAAVLRY